MLHDHPANDNEDAAVALPAARNGQHCLEAIDWSYTLDPNGGGLDVYFGDAEDPDWSVDITHSGPGTFPFGQGLYAPRGSDVRIVLRAGGVGNHGKLNVRLKEY